MQNRTSPDRFGTTTIPAHQGVGLLTFEITPSVSREAIVGFVLALVGC